MAAANNVESSQHPLSLKVMRLSRPSLAAHWEPFFSSSPSYSAHSTAHTLSLQGPAPLGGHPKTLRDLSNAGQMFTLPAAFGPIQLGETFTCCLAVNNETSAPVEGIEMKVEMQTATSKVPLSSVVGGVILPKDTTETVVSHEIRELGQHVLCVVLACTDPSGLQRAVDADGQEATPSVLSFRKFYKFTVTNPLSVKTKVHVPKSPTAAMSSVERDKLFLEVHIQNLTQSPLWFEKIQLEPVEGWQAEDGNLSSPGINSNDGHELMSAFSGSVAIMQPQDVRQYIYKMTPKVAGSSRVRQVPSPGTVVPLARLDISWRSSMGEPGRLLTSVLSRRIPLPSTPSPSNVPAPSALPPHLQKPTQPPSRSRSPSLASQQQNANRVSTPPLPPAPQRSASPLKRSTLPSPLPHRPLSPGHGPEHALVTGAHRFGMTSPNPPSTERKRADIEVDLIVTDTPMKSTVKAEEQFRLPLSLAVSVTTPPERGQRSRVLKIALQHTILSDEEKIKMVGDRTVNVHSALRPETRVGNVNSVLSSPRSGSIDAITPRQVLSPGPTPGGGDLSSPELVSSPAGALSNAANFATEPLADRLKSMVHQDLQNSEGRHHTGGSGVVRVPSPYIPLSPEERRFKETCTGEVKAVGPSLTILPAMTFKPGTDNAVQQSEQVFDFDLSYISLSRGFTRFGGLRLWLIEDTMFDEHASEGTSNLYPSSDGQSSNVRLLKEWNFIGEVWVV